MDAVPSPIQELFTKRDYQKEGASHHFNDHTAEGPYVSFTTMSFLALLHTIHDIFF